MATINENGTLIYQVKNWFNNSTSVDLFNNLVSQVPWHQNKNSRFGVLEPRLCHAVAEDVDGTGQPIIHKYGGITIPTCSWHSSPIAGVQMVRQLRDRLEQETGIFHDAALIQYYRNGKDYNREHFDSNLQSAQSRFGPVVANKTVYCLSLGATRTFYFKRNSDGARFDYILDHGDLLVMEGNCQDQFVHCLPKSVAKASGSNEPGSAIGPRISITWRLLGKWNFCY